MTEDVIDSPVVRGLKAQVHVTLSPIFSHVKKVVGSVGGQREGDAGQDHQLLRIHPSPKEGKGYE